MTRERAKNAAWAPKTYQRILRGPRTFFSAARSSTLAGGRGTFETLRQSDVGLDVEGALFVGRPPPP
jgi:hypothetical protein